MKCKGRIKTEPIPALRDRIHIIDGKIISFTPTKSRNAQTLITQRLGVYGFIPYPEHLPLKLTITFYRTQSKHNKKRVKDIAPVRRPDLDNYIKLFEDAANGILYADDAQITTVVAKKRWTDRRWGYITFELVEDTIAYPSASCKQQR